MFPSGFPAASTSSPFARPATTGFNPPVFGGTPTGTIFGSNTTQPSGGLFGGNTANPTFGQTQTTQPAFGGFTAASSGSTSIFGTQQNASTTGGLFGSNTTQAFGQPKTSFGFGSTQQSTSLFGQQPQQTSIFGQPSTQSASGLFGSTPGFGATATASATGGTHQIKFTPVTGTDTIVKNGTSTSVSTRHHCITCMKEYENKSLEELRLEDYAAGRKGPQQGAQPAGGMFGAPAQPSLFGSTTANASGGLFGSENKSLFGPTSQGFGTTTGSNMFGATNQSNSLFGKPAGTATPFGAPATTSTSTFGFNNTSTNLFGSNTAQKPFGTTTPQTGSLFGSTSQPSTGFGTQPTGFGSSFATQPAQNGGLFGAKPAFTLGNTSSGFSFNQPTSTSTSSSIFGAKPAATGFGTGFGTATSTSTGFGSTTFGQTNQNASPFGASNFNKPTGFNFGQTQPNTSLGLNLGGGTSLFNNTASKPGGLFGQTNTGGNLFGSSGGFGTTNTFSTGSNPLGGLGNQSTLGSGLGSGLGSLGSQSTQNPINQHLNAYSSKPFGDSPLFKNLLAPTGKADELIKPTSPAAQKALISGQNYKISPKSSSKIRIKPVESSSVTKKSLFDGLDGEDLLSSDLMSTVARPNPKHLVIQPRLLNDVSITQRSRLSGLTNPINEMSPVIKTSPKVSNLTRNDARDHYAHDETVVTSRPQANLKLREKQPSTAILDHAADVSQNMSNASLNEENKETAASVTSSSDSDLEDTVPPELDGTLTEHPTRIVLRRAGYYTIPSLSELATMVAPDGSCIVDNFTVGRLNYGNVFYPDSFDVAGLDLDEIVHFRHKEVMIYPDDEKKPPVGTGLNRRAQVTLDRVWPIDKSTRLPITDPARIVAMDYESKLTRASAKHNTRFVEYRPQTGSWVFKVEHFSKYGLSDSDEEDQPPGDIKKIKMGPAESIVLNKNISSSTPLQPTKQIEHTLASRAVLLGEEDEEMDDGITTPFALDDELERRQHFSPTSKLASEMGTSSHKVQLMKASFFDHGDFNIDGEYLDYEDLDQPPVFQVNGFGFDAKKLAQAFNWYKKSEMASMDGYSDAEPEYDTRPELETEPPEPSPNESFDPDVIEQAFAEQIRPKSYVLRHKGFVPYSEVLGNSVNAGCLSDLCIFKGRSCRVGWGPGSKICIHSTNTVVSADPTPHLFSILQGRTKDDMSPSLVQCHNLYTTETSPIISFKETVIPHLEIVYKQSIFNQEGSSPHVTPKINVVGLHRHNVTAQNLANGFSDPYLKDSCAIWSLCAALWGNIDDCSPDSHSCVMQRKTAVSDWLEVVLSEEVLKEAALMGGTASVYSYLTGHKTQDACEEAHKIGDYQMPLLFNQCGSGQRVQSMIRKQLDQWRDTEADTHIDPHRLKCLMLAAGLKLHSLSNGVLNSCLEISWLRAFALHVWYFTSMSASVTDALVDYEKSFDESMEEGLASPPAPLYTDHYSTSAYDVRYHLLKLFSTKSYPLEPILDPVTFTPDSLDYRLSWMLMRVLMELGYSHVSPYAACMVHMSFASQLEAQGIWHWAIFVLLHHPDEDIRERSVKELLERHVSLGEENEEEHFVRSRLKVPARWVFEAKAIRAKVCKRYDDAANYLIKAGNWEESHEVIMRHISSTAIVNENYEYLESLLKELAIDDRCKDIPGWTTGGEVVLEYLGVVRQVNEAVAARDPAIGYHLERLQNQLKDLCLKINLMKAVTPLDRLSRAEMAKRTADHLQNLVIAHCSDESIQGLNVLSHLMSELPLSSDYAQQEWLAVFASWQNSLSHSETQ